MAENTDKTPLENNNDTIAEIMTLAANLPDASGGTDISLGLTNTSVDQIIKVKSIDADGRPTEWKATTDSTPLIVEFTMGVSANEPPFSSNYSFDQISAAVNAGRYVVGYSSYISISGDPEHDRYGIYFDLMSTQDVAMFQFFDPYYNYYIKVYVSSSETTAVGMFVKAESNHYGGIKADSAEGTDTQPVRIGDDGKLYTKNVDIVTPTAESTDTQAASAKAVWDMLGGGGSSTDISLGVTGASVGDIVKVKAVDANGKPTEWEAAGIDTPYIIISQGDITEDVSVLEFTGIENYNDFLFIGNMAAGNTSGVRLRFNGKLASTKWGSYFVHNHQKLTVAHLQIDRERKIYLFQATAQSYNEPYNQDSCGDVYGQTLNGETEITSFSFLMDDSKYIKAGSSYVLYGR